MGRKALEGITVLDMTLAESGTVATMTLSLLGATVYHIEKAGTAAYGSRYRGSILRNLNKKNITLNGKTPEGKELMWELIKKADIIFENYSPGAWERMGFGYEDVKKVNPDVIYISLKGFTKTSEWGDCVTYDPVASSFGGSAFLSGYEDDKPMLCGINVADSGSGILGSLTTLLALLERRMNGSGQYIEAAMRDAVVALCRKGFAEYAANGKVKRHGNSFHGADMVAPYNMYPTKPSEDPLGDYVQIACKTQKDFENLCNALGKPELAQDRDLATPALRYSNREKIDAVIKEWTLVHTKMEAAKILAKQYGVPAGAVQSIKELLSDKFLQSTIYKKVSDKVAGDMLLPLIPLKMSASPIDEIISPGLPDNNNMEVYHEILGISEERIRELHNKGVI